jgi:hypothetical protein
MERREFMAHATAAFALAGTPAEGEAAAEPPTAPVVTALEDVERAVAEAIASKRLGQPVFVRYTLHGTARGELLDQLARLTQAVSRWLGQPLARLTATGSLEGGQISLSLQYAQGAAALVTYARGVGPGDGADVLVLGNHGSAAYSGTAAPLARRADYRTAHAPSPVRAAIQRAIASGRTEALRPDEAP